MSAHAGPPELPASPAAQTSFGPVAATVAISGESSRPNPPFGGSWVYDDHRLPSQCSSRKRRSVSSPTAQTSCGEIATTSNSSAFGRRATRVQRDPVQCRTIAARVASEPTAHTSRPEVAATAERRRAPATVTCVHCDPSQCSASAPVPGPSSVADVKLPSSPTAHTSSWAATATPSSTPFTSGLATTDHCVPSQCSVSAVGGGPLPQSEGPPTAHASSGVEAATANNSPLVIGALGTTLHESVQAGTPAVAFDPRPPPIASSTMKPEAKKTALQRMRGR